MGGIGGGYPPTETPTRKLRLENGSRISTFPSCLTASSKTFQVSLLF